MPNTVRYAFTRENVCRYSATVSAVIIRQQFSQALRKSALYSSVFSAVNECRSIVIILKANKTEFKCLRS